MSLWHIHLGWVMHSLDGCMSRKFLAAIFVIQPIKWRRKVRYWEASSPGRQGWADGGQKSKTMDLLLRYIIHGYHYTWLYIHTLYIHDYYNHCITSNYIKATTRLTFGAKIRYSQIFVKQHLIWNVLTACRLHIDTYWIKTHNDIYWLHAGPQRGRRKEFAQ